MTAAVSGRTAEHAEGAETFLDEIHVGPAPDQKPSSLGGLCGESETIRTVIYGC